MPSETLPQSELARRLHRAVLLPVTLLLLVAGILTWQIYRLKNAADWVDHTDQVLVAVNHVQKLLLDLETGYRGFLLARDPVFLEPYNQSLGSVRSEIRSLQSSVADNPSQVARLRDLERQVDDWIGYAHPNIQAALREGIPKPDASDTAGKQRMDAMRAQVASIVGVEQGLRDQRYRHDRRQLGATLTLTFVLALSLGLALGISSRYDLKFVGGTYGSALEQARRERESLRALIEGVRDHGISSIDPDGMILTWNHAAEQVTGFTHDDAVGQPFGIVYPESDRRAGRPARALATAREHGRLEAEGWRVRKDGGRFWSDGVLTALYTQLGELRGFTHIFRDHSQRRHVEEERAALMRKLREAVDARDEFLALASHELKTPLTSLMLQLQNVERQAGKSIGPVVDQVPVRTVVLANFHRQVRRLRDLVEDMLEVARIHSGDVVYDFHRVPMAAVVLQAVDPLRDEARELGTALEIHVEEGVEGDWDAGRLAAALENVLHNAIRHGKGKPVRIEGIRRDDRAEIRVTDDGPGIAPEQRERIFERFTRAQGISEHSGLGLGLYLARETLEAHGGRIRVESEPGRGATFTLEVPLSPESEA